MREGSCVRWCIQRYLTEYASSGLTFIVFGVFGRVLFSFLVRGFPTISERIVSIFVIGRTFAIRGPRLITIIEIIDLLPIYRRFQNLFYLSYH